MFKRFLREYYLFSPGERRALFLVSLLLVISLLIRLVLPLIPRPDPPGMEQFRQEALRLQAALALQDSLEKKGEEEASFVRKKRDASSFRKRVAVYSAEKPCDLNRADSLSLLPLPGIGPVFAGRIIKYRELLGGYVHPDQLLEVYGMDSARYLPVKEMLTADHALLKLIPVNTAEFGTMLRHPYLDYEDVLNLVRYRDQVGEVRSIEQLKLDGILVDTGRNPIQHYLNFMENRH